VVEKQSIRKNPLRDKIGSAKASKVALSPLCALQSHCQVCNGRNYTLTTRGAYVSAELCECITNCEACFGSMMLDKGAGSKPCNRSNAPNPKRVVALLRDSGIPARYKDSDFACYNNFTGNAREVMNKLQTWLKQTNPHGGAGLLLSGPVGVGKTFLLASITKFFCSRGVAAKFIDFHRLLAVIRSAYTDRKSEESVLGPLIGADVLVIDELGKGRNNDWEQEKLDQIVMGRYNQNKMVIASTNYSLTADKKGANIFQVPLDQDMPQKNNFNPDVFGSLESRVGQRIFSRLYETSLLLELKADDYRRRLHNQNNSSQFENHT